MSAFITLKDRFGAWYRKIFTISEIETEPVLQWMFGASLFYFFVSFNSWIERTSITVETAQAGRAICWPYFQNCSDLYFLHAFPYGYSHSAFYMVLYAVMCLTVYYMWQSRWVRAHMLLAALLAWKLFVIFVLSFTQAGPYDFYHITLTSILLFAAHKEYFLKLSFVFMYFMSVTVKFTPAWVLGTYFTSMKSGLPYFGPLTFLLTNFVIFVQIIDSWFLLSKSWILQRLSFTFAVIFHLYSGVLVYYNYPSVSLPAVLILFGPLYRYTPTPFTRRATIGWVILGLLAAFQLLGFMVSPNRFLTLEGHRFGMFMFEANHQCQETITTVTKRPVTPYVWSGLQCNGLLCLTDTSATTTKDGLSMVSRRYESASSWYRCDPYEMWTRAKQNCNTPDTVRVSMQYDHSINGGPFYRMIDEADICNLSYKAFEHNDWIKVPPEAPVIGYPVQNFYSR